MPKGMGRKNEDRWAIPLCSIPGGCHDKAHAAGDDEAWLASRGVDGRSVATALWAARGDLKAMERIVFRSFQGRIELVARMRRVP